MAQTSERRPFYWEQLSAKDIRKRSDQLAALRSGINAEPGTVPAMWRFYTSSNEGRMLDAEHYTLTLFAIHQQSQSDLVHRADVPIPSAIRKLHTEFEGRARFNKEAVDRRFFAAVTAPELREVAHHLRGLIRQIHSLPIPAPFDYTRLFWDFTRWSAPEERQRIQRRWGLGYYGAVAPDDPVATAQSQKGDA